MTPWSEELIQSTKDHFRKHYGAELTTDDAIESLNNLTAFFEILIRWDREGGTQKQGETVA
ncbi:MAG: hypothetical protein P1R58_06275 [bacterium]|nr:hypothetical protein [bacterium]